MKNTSPEYHDYVGMEETNFKKFKLGQIVEVPANVDSKDVLPLNGPNPKQRFGDKKVAMGQSLPVGDMYESMAMMDGTWKYGWRNFRDTKVEAMTYVHAAIRHIQCWAECEEVAEDSGIHHLGHAKACLGILLDAQANGNLIDDRKPGVFPKMLKKMEAWVEKRKKYHAEKNTKTDTISACVTDKTQCTCFSTPGRCYYHNGW